MRHEIREGGAVRTRCAETPANADDETRRALAAVVAEMAVSTGPPSSAMRKTFADVVRLLGVSAAEGDRLLASAEAAWDDPNGPLPVSFADRDAPATREGLDRAYLRAVARYDPMTMAQFGAHMAALAVHRLSDLTLVYESDVARLDTAVATDEPAEETG